MRVLFLVKQRTNYGCERRDHNVGGLFNSARFVVDMLDQQGIVTKLVQVVDNNDIDREVAEFKPDFVILEALWVVPEKLAVLTKLHPKVRWVVRIHSEIPFLAHEGVAIDWLFQYSRMHNVHVACNSSRATRDLPIYAVYLPNWYPATLRGERVSDPRYLNIGCFGAIRPFKNQLIQAMAAIEFADSQDEMLQFHVNATRCEQNGWNVLRNIRALFDQSPHELVEHEWESHDDFLATMLQMDVSMAVSFSETFNIVSADAVTSGVPVVVSPEVKWVSPRCYADPHNIQHMIEVLGRVSAGPLQWKLMNNNLRRLARFDAGSTEQWLTYLNG